MLAGIFLLFIIIFINQFQFSSLYLFYELKTSQEKNSIESLLSFNSTYTVLEIGSPPQKVNFNFTLDHHQISFTNNNNGEICSPKKAFYQKKSSSFKGPLEIEPRKDNNNHKYIYTDNFKTPYEINYSYDIEIEEFPFFSMEKINYNDSNYLCGHIGLAIMQYEIYKPEEEKIRKIYENLAKYGIKRNEDFSFFHKNGKDYLIYGIFLHNQFSDMFKNIKHVDYLHPSMRKNSFDLFWDISMKEVYYNNVHSDPNKFISFEINPLFELIVGTIEYKIIL